MGKSTYHIAVLVCAALALAGCNKFDKFEWRSGDTVKFGAGSKGDAMTKTSYGDVYTDGDNKKKQIVNWKADDLIRIACAQASTTEEGTSTIADYKTSPTEIITNTDKSGRKESRATLSLAGNNDKGLRWGSETATHKFYGVYPSPATAGKSGDALSDEGVLSGSIPETQSGTPVSDGKAFVDMTNLYMVAKKTVAAGTQSFGENEVFLYFTPITTAIEFEVTNAMTDDLVIDNIELISTNHHLSGGFETDLSEITDEEGYDYPDVDAASGAGNNAKVSFGTSGLTLQNNEKLTFTIFLLPEDDLDDLTFRINRKGVGAGYIQTALKWVLPGETDATFIEFDRCKKHFVKGLFANEGAKWTVCFDPSVDSWDNTDINQGLNDPNLGSLSDLISWDQGEESNLNMRETPEASFTFGDESVSKTHTFTGTPSADGVTFDIISTMGADPQDWKIKSVGGVAVDGTTYTTADGDLKVENVSGKLKITDKRQKVSYGDNAHWTTPGTDWYSKSWGSEAGGLNKGTVDLSKYDFKSDTPNAHNMRTSNCYIIRHAGTYRIPLVYGNAIDYVKNTSTGVNTDAYNPSNVTSGTNVLKPFVNHLGYGIIDPYIENNTNDGTQKYYTPKGKKTDEKYNNYISASSASVVWQDNGTVIPNVAITPAESPLERKNTDTDATAYTKYTASNVRYLQFTISQEDIRQCNALIAVKDADNNIMWSWHIWITNDPAIGNSAITVNNGTQNYNFFPTTCLGWLEPQMYEEKPDVEVILEQEESGETIAVTISQELYDDFYSNGTYYQWGRKDPMPSAEITNYSIFNGQATLLKESILAPNRFYMFAGNWYSTNNYFNLWSGKVTTTGDMENSSSMVKTVYDPSPVGYKVPAPNAFSSLTTANSTGVFKKGMYFYTTSAKDNTIFFATCGFDNRSSGVKTSAESGYYWSSTNDNMDNKRGRRFYFSSSTEPNLGNNNKTEGFAIRPVTE